MGISSDPDTADRAHTLDALDEGQAQDCEDVVHRFVDLYIGICVDRSDIVLLCEIDLFSMIMLQLWHMWHVSNFRIISK